MNFIKINRAQMEEETWWTRWWERQDEKAINNGGTSQHHQAHEVEASAPHPLAVQTTGRQEETWWTQWLGRRNEKAINNEETSQHHQAHEVEASAPPVIGISAVDKTDDSCPPSPQHATPSSGSVSPPLKISETIEIYQLDIWTADTRRKFGCSSTPREESKVKMMGEKLFKADQSDGVVEIVTRRKGGRVIESSQRVTPRGG